MVLLTLLALQLRKEHDVSNRLCSGQHHDKPVDSDSDSAGRRHAVFEGEEKVLVDFLHLFTSLLFEAATLHIGIVQL